MQPILDHVQVTVKDMSVAVPFYDRLMPLLGYDPRKRVEATVDGHLHVVNYSHPQLDFAINSPREAFANDDVHRRRPGALHHLAFQAETRAEVERLHAELQVIGAPIVSGPQLHPEYGPNYYAVFFKDLEGIKYEIVCTVAE